LKVAKEIVLPVSRSEHLGDFRPAALTISPASGTGLHVRLASSATSPETRRLRLYRRSERLGSAGRNLRVQLAAERLVNVKTFRPLRQSDHSRRVVWVASN